MKVEVCATSLQSILNAQQAGADRIELCAELSLGGITPSYGFIKEAVRLSELPIHLLIRPRSGNFYYSEVEYQTLLEDIRMAKQLGVAGVVVGFLHSNNQIHWEQLQQAMAFAKPLAITFHRAFDLIPDPETALKRFIELGVHRILCSGKALQATEGIATLERWKTLAGKSLEIQPGGGIDAENCQMFYDHGFESLHLSAQRKNLNHSNAESVSDFWEQQAEVADLKMLQEVVSICKP